MVRNVSSQRISVLKQLDTQVGNSGADEHSQITQADKALTPGASENLLHLLGSTTIPPEIQSDLTFSLTNQIADGLVKIDSLPIEDMEYEGHLAIAFMLVQNSVNGKGLERKTSVLGGMMGNPGRKLGGFFRKNKGYDSGFNEGSGS